MAESIAKPIVRIAARNVHEQWLDVHEEVFYIVHYEAPQGYILRPIFNDVANFSKASDDLVIHSAFNKKTMNILVNVPHYRNVLSVVSKALIVRTLENVWIKPRVIPNLKPSFYKPVILNLDIARLMTKGSIDATFLPISKDGVFNPRNPNAYRGLPGNLLDHIFLTGRSRPNKIFRVKPTDIKIT